MGTRPGRSPQNSRRQSEKQDDKEVYCGKTKLVGRTTAPEKARLGLFLFFGPRKHTIVLLTMFPYCTHVGLPKVWRDTISRVCHAADRSCREVQMGGDKQPFTHQLRAQAFHNEAVFPRCCFRCQRQRRRCRRQACSWTGPNSKPSVDSAASTSPSASPKRHACTPASSKTASTSTA